MSSKNSRTATRKDNPMAEQPIKPTNFLGILLPIKPLMIKPTAGKTGINQM
jgi:hypothetical protein